LSLESKKEDLCRFLALILIQVLKLHFYYRLKRMVVPELIDIAKEKNERCNDKWSFWL